VKPIATGGDFYVDRAAQLTRDVCQSALKSYLNREEVGNDFIGMAQIQEKY
jgi:hypothetical protein